MTNSRALGIALKINDLSKSFNKGSVQALRKVNLTFQPSVLHGIIGPAGTGKTTLLRLILNLLKPDSGEIIYLQDGQTVNYNAIMPCIAYMPEQRSLYKDLSIKEHLDFFASMYGLSKETYQQKLDELLSMTRLNKFLDRPAGKLSGGMYKKLGLMCAMLRNPQMILLDEPTNGVDPISRREFWDILNEATKQNITVIMTTAYMDEAARCEIVHLMEDGVVLEEGEPLALLQQEKVNNFDEFFIRRNNHE